MNPRKSYMTAENFRYYRAACGMTMAQLARATYSTTASISKYETGKAPIPERIAKHLVEVVKRRAHELNAALGQTALEAAINPLSEKVLNGMLAAVNERKREASDFPRFPGRTRTDHVDEHGRTKYHPAYQMNHKHFGVFALAVGLYRKHVRELQHKAYTPEQHDNVRAELADLDELANHCQHYRREGGPYVFHIHEREWEVISRALRHLQYTHKDGRAQAVYRHWRKHKAQGFKPKSYAKSRQVPAHE